MKPAPTTAWEDRATLHHAQLAESINSGRPVVEQTLQQMQAMGLGHQQSLGLIDRLLTQQAFMISTQEIFYLSALLFLALIPLVWIARRMHRPGLGRSERGPLIRGYGPGRCWRARASAASIMARLRSGAVASLPAVSVFASARGSCLWAGTAWRRSWVAA